MSSLPYTCNDIITVVRDPHHSLGKEFWLEGGSVRKKACVSVSLAFAVMHEIPDIQALEKLLREVGEDTHAAIINAKFKGIEVGEEFVILSENKFKELLKLEGREKCLGVHRLVWEGKPYKAVGRFKQNMEHSSWQLLDRDTDEHTPPEIASLDFDGWLRAVDRVLSVSSCEYLRVGSSSARVERT